MATDRDIDLKWISENLRRLKAHADECFHSYGRGIVAIDVSTGAAPNPPMAYISAAEVPDEDENARRLVRNYVPSTQIVVMVMKADGTANVYQISAPSMKHVN